MASYRTVTVTATIATNTVTANGEVSEHIFTADADGQQVIVTDPYVAVETVEEGVLLTVRDAHEETQAVIYNGFSPTATVTKSGDTATISITDNNGTTTATVTDGVRDWNNIENVPKLLTGVSLSGGNGEVDIIERYNDGTTAESGVELGGYVNGGSYSNGTLKLKRKNIFPDITVFTADSSPTSGSQQLVRSGGVYTALASKANTSHTHTKSQITDFPSLASVATSGSYNDLTNKPTIPVVPTNVSAFTNDAGYLTSAPVTSVNGQTGAVTGLQTTGNKVTSLSSSSTDTQYPSAKCVYDLVGNIEALLASI